MIIKQPVNSAALNTLSRCVERTLNCTSFRSAYGYRIPKALTIITNINFNGKYRPNVHCFYIQ